MLVRKTLRASLTVGLLLGAAMLTCSTRSAQATELFYNYYVPGPCDYPAQPAQMYVSPRPVPPLVGHTYITYQPMMAHEMLYKHKRTYYRFNPMGGHTVTHVHWW